MNKIKKYCLPLLFGVGICLLFLLGDSDKPNNVVEKKDVVTEKIEKTDVTMEKPEKTNAEILENWDEKLDGIILVKWEHSTKKDRSEKDEYALTYKDGEITLWVSFRFRNGQKTVPISLTQIERPTGNPNERKFENEPEACSLCEYRIISKNGTVKVFDWAGNLLYTELSTYMHSDVMKIGKNIQVKECVPVELSPASLETIRLYRQLHAFKNDKKFAQMGFAPNGPYHVWMEMISKVSRESGLDVLAELSFSAGHVESLGMNYMQLISAEEGLSRDVSKSTLDYIQWAENTIQAGIANATCQREF